MHRMSGEGAKTGAFAGEELMSIVVIITDNGTGEVSERGALL